MQGITADTHETKDLIEKSVPIEKVRLEKCIPLREGKVVVKGKTMKDVEEVRNVLKDKVEVRDVKMSLQKRLF